MMDSTTTRLAFREGSLPAILIAAAAAATVAILGSALKPDANDPAWVAGTAILTTIVPSIPAAIAYRRTARRRDPAAEVIRLENGEVRRPVALVVILAAAGITLLVTVIFLVSSLFVFLVPLVPDASLLLTMFFLFSLVGAPIISAILINRVFRRLGHYLGHHPYLATAIAVLLSTGGVVGLLALVISAAPSSGANSALGIVVIAVMFGIALMIGAELGTRHARLRQGEFIEVSLRRTINAPPDPALRRIEPGDPRPVPIRMPLREDRPAMFAAPDPSQRRLA